MTFISCDDKKEIKKEVLDIPVAFDVVRFDQEFGKAQPEDLQEIKTKYPYLFPKRYTDDFWKAKMQDTLQIELYQEVSKAFPNFTEQGEELELLFKHIKYYFPRFKSPKVITVTSEVDYRNKVVLADSIMLVALDTYLGADHFFYEGIAKFTSKNLRKEQLVVDVASEYAKQLLPPNNSREFIGQLLYYGKMLYLVDLFAPFVEDYEKIGYTEDEFNWAINNEGEIWKYFTNSKLLYSTDTKLASRFLNPAPFSKFYLQLDNESPGMLGRYIGWQIVRSYMENNNVSLLELIEEDPITLFKKAKFKPKR